MNVRKIVGPLLALLVLAGVGGGIYFSATDKRRSDGVAEKMAERQAARITVRVLTGSEKEKFLADPELTALLETEGITLQVQKSGSREIATRADLKTFDVAYPAGAHAAVKIAQVTGAQQSFSTFYTPMAIASWKALLPVLDKSGLVAQKDGAWFITDMPKLVGMMEKGTRWKDLPGNTAYAVGKSVLVTSTDVRKSNSGALYLALASYIANDSNVVDTELDADKVADAMVRLFSKQGYQESSSTGPFEDYTAMGIGKAPLVMVYEQQFLEYAFERKTPNPEMVLLYPSPTLLSKHTLVVLSANGLRFAQVMTGNPKVGSIAQRYGFRTENPGELFAAADAKKLALPRTVVDVVDPPSYDILERLIGRIEVAMKATATPAAGK